jgi:polyphosphate kinase
MPRNINRRVEVLFPVREQAMIRYLRDDVLATYLADNTRARRMLPDGSYERLKPHSKAKPLDSQEWLLHRHQQKG